MSWKILQFDDNELMANMYSLKFKKPEFDYIWAEHPTTDKAKDLIKYVMDVKPDLIIMDIIMPVMDGFKATEILKKDNRTNKIPIIFLTNMAQEDDINRGIELGAEDYFITSNHAPSELSDKIKGYLNNPNSYKAIYNGYLNNK